MRGLSINNLGEVERQIADSSETAERQAYVVDNAVREFTFTAERLEGRCRELARQMEKVADKAAAAGRFERYSINSLGEVQSAGHEIDRLCGELQVRSDTFAMVCNALGVDSQALVEQLQSERGE